MRHPDASTIADIADQIRRSIRAKEELLNQGGAEVIARMAAVSVEAFKAGRRMYVLGNGGSAADSQHIAGELVGRFLMNRAALPCVALTTDTSVMTAVANDLGAERIFVRQVEAHVREGDVLLAISTSGQSPNVNLAVEKAKQLGAHTLALSGRGGGRLAELADICLTVPGENSPRIQEAQILVEHILCDLIEQGVCGGA